MIHLNVNIVSTVYVPYFHKVDLSWVNSVSVVAAV